MKFARVGPVGHEVPVIVSDDGSMVDLRGLTDDLTPDFLASGGLERAREAAIKGELPAFEGAGMRIGSPVPRPGKLICIGLNYAAHAAEAGAEPPTEPVIFFKGTDTVIGPNDDVLVPRTSRATDYEVELAIIIGAKGRYLESQEAACEIIAGYTISNDVSERHFQLERGGQWVKGKSCETFNPLGPWLVTPDEVGDPQELRLQTSVNGELRQDSSTGDMIFDVATIVHYVSQFMVLEPGDVINTGTPEGVALGANDHAYLVEGDVMRLQIAGLGAQEQRLVQA